MNLKAAKHSPIERFARWHHLKNLRQKLDAGATNMNTATLSAKQESPRPASSGDDIDELVTRVEHDTG